MVTAVKTEVGEDPIINVAELGQYIKRKRESERLSLRAVAKLTQVSASPYLASRMAREFPIRRH